MLYQWNSTNLHILLSSFSSPALGLFKTKICAPFSPQSRDSDGDPSKHPWVKQGWVNFLNFFIFYFFVACPQFCVCRAAVYFNLHLPRYHGNIRNTVKCVNCGARRLLAENESDVVYRFGVNLTPTLCCFVQTHVFIDTQVKFHLKFHASLTYHWIVLSTNTLCL